MRDDDDMDDGVREAIRDDAEPYLPEMEPEPPEPPEPPKGNGHDDEPPEDWEDPDRRGPQPGERVNPGDPPKDKKKEKPAEHWWEEKPPPWKPTRPSEWTDKQVEPRVFIMEDWIPLGEYIALYGVSGVRKTDFLLQALMAASLGLYFCGYKMRHSVTFGVFCEDTEQEIMRRADRIAGFYGKTRADFTGFFFISLASSLDTEFVNFDNGRMHISDAFIEFEKQLSETQASFAVLDTIADFFGGEEINRRQLTRFVRLLGATSISKHCAIMGTRHPSQRGKTSGTFESGSTGWEGKERARLVLRDPIMDPNGEDKNKDPIGRQPSHRRILTRAMSNYAQPGISIPLIFENGGFSVERSAETPRGKARDLAAEAKFLELLADVTKTDRYVHDAVSSPRFFAPTVFANHPKKGNFTEPEFKRAMQRLEASGRIALTWKGTASKGHYEYKEIQGVRPNGSTETFEENQ